VTNELLLQTWEVLRTQPISSEDLSATLPLVLDGDETSFELAISASGDLHLLIPVEGDPRKKLPPTYNGLQLRKSHSLGRDYINLQAPTAHASMFATLCAQVIEAIHVQQRDPWAAAINIVQSWYSAWRPVRLPMSKTEQIGLAGELLILQRLWIPSLGSEAVHYWSGPDRERHDFVSEHLHMEVKTTTKSRHEHEISRVDQLMVPEQRRLVLASVQVEESSAGAQSIATLVDAIFDSIRLDGAARDAFQLKLDKLDWDDEMRQSPDLLRFNVRAMSLFEVDEEFPALPGDFQLPEGILSVRYTISLANLPFLDSTDVQTSILAINTG